MALNNIPPLRARHARPVRALASCASPPTTISCSPSRVLCYVVIRRLVHSRAGRAMIALRENEPLATSVGIDVTRYLVLATMVSAAMAGAAGALYAHYVRIVDPDVFLFIYTVTMVIMVVTGGKGTLAGPIVGGMIFGLLPEVLRAFADQARGAVGDLRRADDAGRLLPARGHRAGRAPLVAGRASAHLPTARRPMRKTEAAAMSKPRRRRARRRGPVRSVSAACTAVEGMTFEVREGEVLSLIGPNGAGKTSAFNAITGYVEPSRRQDRLPRQRGSIGLKPNQIAALGVVRTFQKTSVFAGQTVLDNVLIGLHLRSRQRPLAILLGLPSVAREEKELVRRGAARSCAFVGLEPRARRSWPPRCPTASCGCSRWRSRWPRGRSCCCSTSRCPA